MSGYDPPKPNVVYVEKKSSWGCFIYGCLTVVILSILLIVCAGIGGYWWAQSTVTQYTSDKAAAIPRVDISPEALKEIESRVQSFRDLIDKGETPSPLILTADEINGLINKNEEMKGKVHVSIGDGQVSGDVSIPTDFIPLGVGKGRHFNASVTLNVSLEDGVLVVTIDEATVNGNKVPPQFIESMANQNLAKEMYKDPKIAETLKHFESLQIKDDKLILTPKMKIKSPINPEISSSLQTVP